MHVTYQSGLAKRQLVITSIKKRVLVPILKQPILIDCVFRNIKDRKLDLKYRFTIRGISNVYVYDAS